MNSEHQRGLLLLQQGRHDLAEREFRRSLASAPDDPLGHAFLSLCLDQAKRTDEALAEADEAVRCGPNLAFCHYVKGTALQSKKRLAEAQAAALTAIQLDPDDADYPALLAAIAIERRDWKGALEAANRGLALDPEQLNCLNLRAMALVQLGRKDEASATLGTALAENPDNAWTHANQGWMLLHRGDHKQALEHFREALRIDPDMEWARSGIVESLKARFWIYRVMLGFFLWMGRQSAAAQWVVILGIVFGRQILNQVAQANPALKPLVTPILVLSFGFVLMTWVSSPLFNLTLRFNKFGRLALTADEKLASTCIGLCFFLAGGLFVASLVTGNDIASLGMMYFGFLLFPLAITFRQDVGRNRWIAAALAGGLALVGGFSLLMLVLNIEKMGSINFVSTWIMFIWGCMLSTWLGSFLGSSRIGG